MRRVCVVVVVLFIAAAEAGRIYFPGQLDHAEHDACNTHASTRGTCERSCGSSTNHRNLRKCGIMDSTFLLCCDPNQNKTPERITDISPPLVPFQCGRNSKNYFHFYEYDAKKEVLRPEAALPPSGIEIRKNPPRVRPGIPIEAYNDYINDDTTLPEGVYSVVLGIPAEKNAWPWMALVGEKASVGPRWFCGGVLISEQWVLSALHCFFNHVAQVVRLGEHDYTNRGDGANHEDFDVAETVFYPDFKRPEAYHDLALLKLASKVTIKEFINPVCLPWGKESSSVITNQIATLTGWGDTEYDGFPSSILQEANVTVFPASQCDRSYSNLPHYRATWPQGIGQETVCAGDPAGGRDACQGDSGGPLVSQDALGHYVLTGIVSRGYGCGHKEYPGLYVNLRHPSYLAWIKKIAFGGR